jgi:predicted ribosomally synthesized peptide with SipW-like signal peptide
MDKQKKLLISVLIIGVVLAAGVGATIAYLSATRTVSTSKFAAGTLDLDVSSNGNKLEPFVIENMGENANISGTKTWTVKNTGTLSGRLLIRLQNVNNQENGCNDQEKAVEPNCEADNDGELGSVINLKVDLDGVTKVNSTLATANQSKIGQDWNALSPIIVGPGETKTITAHWAADENAYGNEVQSDNVQFDVNFRLIQLINGPTPTNQ